MEEKSYQHIISYSESEYILEGQWITDPSQSGEYIQSPPFTHHEITYNLSFYFRSQDFFFIIFVDMKAVPSNDYPVAIELSLINTDPNKSILIPQKKFRFSHCTRRAYINFGRSTHEIFTDSDFAPEGSFKIKFKIIHFEKSYNFPKNIQYQDNNIESLIQKKSVNNQSKFFSFFNLKFDFNFDFSNLSSNLSKKQKKSNSIYINDNDSNDNWRSNMVYRINSFDYDENNETNEFSSNYNLDSNFGNSCSEYSGLYNQGSTCYLNSMIQALFHLPAFRSLVYKIPIKKFDSETEMKNSIPFNLQRLFAKMDRSTPTSNKNYNDNENKQANKTCSDLNKPVSTQELTASFGWTSREAFMQHDIQELCRVFLENLENKLKEVPELKDSISYLFRFQMEQNVRCTKIEHISKRLDDFLDLTLEVRGCNNLYESLRQLTAVEKLDDLYSTNDFGKQEAEIFNRFVSLPKVFFMHLKRFEFNHDAQQNHNFGLSKINDRFEFPKILKMAEFILNENKESNNDNSNDNDNSIKFNNNNTHNIDDKDGNDTTVKKEIEKNKEKDDNYEYELFGVLVHSGSAQMGHYYAYLRPTPNEQWYKFNDTNVTCSSEQETIFNNYGDGKSSTNGYMLIYVRRNFISELFSVTCKPSRELVESIANGCNCLTSSSNTNNNNSDNNDIFSKKINKKNKTEIKIITEIDLVKGCDECSLLADNDTGILVLPKDASKADLLSRIKSFLFNNNFKKHGIHNSNLDRICDDDDNNEDSECEYYDNDYYYQNSRFTAYICGSDGSIGERLKKSKDNVCWYGQKELTVFCQTEGKLRIKKKTEILIFLKVYDGVTIKFWKTKVVKQNDTVSVLYKDVANYFKDKKIETDDSNIYYFTRKSKTVFFRSLPELTFTENRIYNGSIVVIHNTNQIIPEITKSEIKKRCNFPINSCKNSKYSNKIEEIDLRIVAPVYSNTITYYIDTKYNMCDTIISEYDNPTIYLFVLRYSLNVELSELKQIVANSVGNKSYDPKQNSILIYGQHLNNENEPSSYFITQKINEPLHRIFFRFFDDVPEHKIGELIPIKVRVNESNKLITILAFKNGKVKDIIEKIKAKFAESELQYISKDNFDEFEISICKSGGSNLSLVNANYSVSSISAGSILQLTPKLNFEEGKQKRIAICHTDGVDLFIPFFFLLNENETFKLTKKRLANELSFKLNRTLIPPIINASIKNENVEEGNIKNENKANDDKENKDKEIDDKENEDLFKQISITLHKINDYYFDTFQSKCVSDSDILFTQVNEKNFLFLELPKAKTSKEFPHETTQNKSNHSGIVINN